MFGLFVETGPYVVNEAGDSATKREFAWTNDYHVIFIDQPVGTGFSFTDDDQGYARNESDVANDMFECLQQFFTLFPQYQRNKFYLTGESYAGKYIPAIGYKIHQEKAVAKMNFFGAIIGDGK